MKQAFIAASVSILLAAAPALAQDVPGHPRENEVNTRLQNQQNRISNGVADGQINAKQAARDSARDAHVAREESRDEAKHDGIGCRCIDFGYRQISDLINRNVKYAAQFQ